MKKYFLHSNGRTIGPYTPDDLRMMNISSSTPVWYEGIESWKNAGDIPELDFLFVANVQDFSQPQSYQQPLPFQSAPVNPHYQFTNTNLSGNVPKKDSGTKIALIIVGVIILVFGLAGFFIYRQVMKVREEIEKTMRSLDTFKNYSPPPYYYDTTGIGIDEAPPAADTTTTGNTLFKETMPEFPGGRGAMITFIRNTIKYPQYAKEAGIEGTVYVSFVIDKDGYVTEPKIARGVDPSLDAEALRMVKKMPRWKAGTMNGHPVRIEMKQPVRFTLQ
ncbi:MAG: TonB family protein [Bacteroidota bacterium]|nr:TonB family protein [Bacteroidota bacterium]